MADEVKVRALGRAAKIILRAIQRKAPTEKSAASFSIERQGSDYVIVSREWGTTMTELNKRHPLFGDRENWYSQNVHHPSRTHFMEKAADAAARAAAEAFAEDWVNVFTDNSDVWEKAD